MVAKFAGDFLYRSRSASHHLDIRTLRKTLPHLFHRRLCSFLVFMRKEQLRKAHKGRIEPSSELQLLSQKERIIAVAIEKVTVFGLDDNLRILFASGTSGDLQKEADSPLTRAKVRHR